MAPNPSRETAALPVEIKRGDKIYTGSYTAAGGTITVAFLDKTRKAALGGAPPEKRACELLTEMVNEAVARR